MQQIIGACLLTVVIETVIFYFAGFRDNRSILVIVSANVLTNLVLNTAGVMTGGLTPAQLLIGEAAVVISEFLIYAGAFKEANAGKVLVLTVVANAASFFTGVLFGF